MYTVQFVYAAPFGHILAAERGSVAAFSGVKRDKGNRINGTYEMYRKFDPHRPYQVSHSLPRTCEFHEAAKGRNKNPGRVGDRELNPCGTDGKPTNLCFAYLAGIFSWLGTTPYPTRDAVLGSLCSIARYATRGSELVFDYRASEELLSASATKTREKIRKFTAHRAGPLKSTFDPRTLRGEVSRLGFEIAEHLPPEEQ